MPGPEGRRSPKRLQLSGFRPPQSRSDIRRSRKDIQPLEAIEASLKESDLFGPGSEWMARQNGRTIFQSGVAKRQNERALPHLSNPTIAAYLIKELGQTQPTLSPSKHATHIHVEGMGY